MSQYYDEVQSLISQKDLEKAAKTVISLAMYSDDFQTAQEELVTLSAYPDINISANAILGFGYLAMKFRQLDVERTGPIILQGLSSPIRFMASQSYDAADMIKQYLNVNLIDQSLPSGSNES